MQQNLKAWNPFLTPLNAAIVLGVFAFLSLVFGILFLTGRTPIYSQPIRYEDCDIGSSREYVFPIDREITNGLYIILRLTNFYQSHFMLMSSKSWPQLEGTHPDPSVLGQCDPFRELNGSVLAPCGAFPRSVFNDTFDFPAPFPPIITTGIAVESYAKRYKPLNGEYVGTGGDWLEMDPVFPGGQENERFINWMHTAPFPTFEKVWGKTAAGKIPPGDYRLYIECNFPVKSFNGTKTLIIQEIPKEPARNAALLRIFFVLLAANASCALAFCGIHLMGGLPFTEMWRIITPREVAVA
jgi:hypothetical protein